MTEFYNRIRARRWFRKHGVTFPLSALFNREHFKYCTSIGSAYGLSKTDREYFRENF